MLYKVRDLPKSHKSFRKRSAKMKIFGFLFSAIYALDSTMLMLMMNQNSVQNPTQANQMNMMLPLLLLDKDDSKSSKSSENKDLLILMMMQGGSMGDTNAILPLLMLDDDSLDFKSFYLYSNMLNQGQPPSLCNLCRHSKLYELFFWAVHSAL